MPSDKYNDIDTTVEFNNNDSMNEEPRVRIKRRRYHPTKWRGYCINAATGIVYPILQGSYEELRLFKAIDASGFYDKNGFVLEKKETNPDSNLLYFESPEEYMRHMKRMIPQEEVNRWHINKNRMFPESNDHKFSKEAYDAIRLERCAPRNSSPTREVSSKDE